MTAQAATVSVDICTGWTKPDAPRDLDAFAEVNGVGAAKLRANHVRVASPKGTVTRKL